MRVAVVTIAVAVFAWTPVRAETCQKSGEEIGGVGKVCYYQCTFGATTVNVGPASLCPLTTQASLSSGRLPPTGGGSCFKTGENTTGMTKQCIYDCIGTRKVMTVGSAQLCPITAR